MYCNHHCPVNLKEQRLFEAIVPPPDITRATKKVGINWKKKKIVPENFIVCSRKVNRRTDNRL